MPIIAAVTAIIGWLRALTPVVKIPLKVGMLIAAFLVIPVPDFVSALPGKIAGLPGSVQYMLYLFQLGFGIGCLVGAWTISLAWSMISGAIKGS